MSLSPPTPSASPRGLSAFPVTPADDRGRIDLAALQRSLAKLVEAGVDSIGLLGSTGSYPFFSREQRRLAVEAAVECVGGRIPLLVGVGALRTDDALDLARDALAAGADCGLLAPVSYLPLLDEEVFQLFRAVAGTGLPLCIYNNPGTTHFDVSTALVGRLATVPGVVALKTGAPATGAAEAVRGLREQVPTGFSVGFSVDVSAPAALLAGGDAWYSVMSGTFPRTGVRLAGAALAGDAAETARQHERLAPLWRLFRDYSSFRVVHLAAGQAPPRPILPLTGAAEADVRRTLDALALD